MTHLSSLPSQITPHVTSGSAFLQDDPNATDTSLAAPKSFFNGHGITVVDCHRNSLEALKKAVKLSFLPDSDRPSNISRQIRVLLGRAEFYSILAREAEERLLQGEGAVQNDPRPLPAEEEIEPPEIVTLLPAPLPPPFFAPASPTPNTVNKIERKQRQLLAKAVRHEETAKRYLREVRNRTKFHALLKEHGDPEGAKKLEPIIEQLKNKADYHTVIARQTAMRAYGYNPQSPGAHKIIAQGNYELEVPARQLITSNSKAQKIKNSQEDLSRFVKTKATPLALVEILQNKKPSIKKQQQLPVAKKITGIEEVAAEYPISLRFPQAKANFA